MKAPRSPEARRAIQLFDDAPRGDRFHVRARWWSAPFPAIEREVPVAGRVLEVGCGHGLLSLYLALCSPTREVLGVDIDEHKIVLARNAAAHLGPDEAKVSFETIATGEPAERLPAGPCDAIVIADVLYLLPADRRREVLAACVERLAPDGVLLVKELDTRPRWKHRLGTAQEIVATRVLRFTQGDEVDIAPMSEFADHLRGLGLTTETRRIDRGYPHPHAILLARR